MTRQLDWDRDGQDWPLREASRFMEAGGTRWHVQVLGKGPPLLLLHGTGAATHSWRHLAPRLAATYRVVMPDLPGHGFSGDLPGRHSLTGMAGAIASLLRVLEVEPVSIVGHSAGAAIAVRMTLDGGAKPSSLVSLAGALLPWRGLPALMFAPLAKLLVANSFLPRFFAGRASDPAVLSRLIESTGSALDPQGAALYGRLASNPAHVAGALAMMADWDLRRLERDLPGLRVPLLAIHGGRDRMVTEKEFREIAAVVRRIEPVTLPALGHLAHEEDAAQCASLILAFLARHP